MDRCTYCEHPLIGHWGTRCHRSSFLRGDCLCTFVDREAVADLAAMPRRIRLDDISIEGMQCQPHGTMEAFEDLFYEAGPILQGLVRRRLEAEFNAMAPAERRSLLEASDVREFLENVGIVSRWSIGPVERR